jgi:hypothetical protein
MRLPKSIEIIPEADSFGHEGPGAKHMKAIGKVVVASARLEQTLGMGISLLMDSVPELVASTILANMKFAERSIVLRGICSYWLGSADKIRKGQILDSKNFKELDRLFDRIDAAQAKRNKIVHSEWSKKGLKGGRVHRFRWMGQVEWRKIGWPEMDYEVVSVEDLEEDAQFIDKVNDELMKYIFSNKFGGILKRYTVEKRNKNENDSD